MITGLNHIALSVADLDRSLRFYRDLLGMQLVAEGTFDAGQYQTIMALEGVRGKAAFLRAKGAAVQIEIFEFERPKPQAADPHRLVCDHGISHFCISVDDVEREYERLKAAGVPFLSATELPHGNKATYGRDPDDNVFELHEAAGSVSEM